MRLVEPQPDGIERVHVDPLREPRFVAQQSLQLGAAARSPACRRRSSAARGHRDACAPDAQPGAARRSSCRCPAEPETRAGPCSRARPIAAARGGGKPSTSPRENRARAAIPRRSLITGIGAGRRDDSKGTCPLVRLRPRLEWQSRWLAAGRQLQQRLRSFGGQVVRQRQQRVLGRLLHVVEPLGGHAVAEELVVGHPGEERPWSRRPVSARRSFPPARKPERRSPSPSRASRPAARRRSLGCVSSFRRSAQSYALSW